MRIVSIKEAAALKGVSYNTICRWIKTGRLSARRQITESGRSYIILTGDLYKVIGKCLPGCSCKRHTNSGYRR